LLDGEIHLELSGETDTGISYGGRLQLLPAAKPRDNGSFVQAGWAWGEFRLGDYGGAAKEMMISAPTIGIGQIDGDLDRFGGPSALIAPYGLNNDDSTKLTYLSPVLFGLRAGLSFTPELSGGGVELVPMPHVDGIDRHRDVTEFAISAARDVGDATVTAAGVYVVGDATAASHLHGLNGGGLGAKLVWDALTIGGGFVYDGAGTLPPDHRPGHVLLDRIVSEFNFGASYQLGRWKLGASWAHDYRKAEASNDIWAAGVDYRIVDGLTVAADLMRFTKPRGAGLAVGDALFLETALHF